MTDREMNTLASHGLEEPFFQLCCCVVLVFGSDWKCGKSLYIILRWIVLGLSGKWFLVLRTYLVYNTVVPLCQFFCCGEKVNFVQMPYSHDHFSKISRTFFVKKTILYKTYVREDQLFLALYGSTTIQSLLFLKKYQELCLIS